jgi:predicted dehydrogenase
MMSDTIKSYSRRKFLKRSAAVLAVPYLLSPGILAAADRASANDRVGVGYVGAGRRAGQLVGLPRDAEIVAVADCNAQHAKAFGAKHSCRVYKDYRDMLEAKDVEAVVVATPDHWHTLPSVHACQAGKDVYCEKPMTLTVREGRLVTNAVRRYERVMQTGSQQRSMAANRLGCQLVRDGAIGKVHTVLAANYASPWNCDLPGQSTPEGIDWDVWCGQTDVVPYNIDIKTPRANPGWISFRPWSGGEMTGWGAHGLDQVQWALGTCLSGPVDVWTEGDKFNPPTYSKPGSIKDGNKICEQPVVHFRYANGTHVILNGGPGGGAIFKGEKGTITIDRGRVTSDPPEIVTDAMKATGYKAGGDTNEHLANWIDCIKSREKPIADVEIGHRSSTVCHLGNIARWVGRPLKWNAKEEQFEGDEEANKLLDREQRKEYEIPVV